MPKFKLEFELPELDRDAGVMITLPHHRVHEGCMYSVSHIFETIAENASAEILLKTAKNKETHLNMAVSAEGKAFVFVYTEPTNSNPGTEIAITRFNQIRGPNSEATAYHSPTITDTGTELLRNYLPAGSKGKTSGGAVKTGTEGILVRDTFYLFRVTSKKTGNATIGIEVVFYEVDLKE
jgi:hypothetical protein